MYIQEDPCSDKIETVGLLGGERHKKGGRGASWGSWSRGSIERG